MVAIATGALLPLLALAVAPAAQTQSTAPPGCPDFVDVDLLTPGKTVVSWSAVAGASAYRVYRSIGLPPNNGPFEFRTETTQLSHDDPAPLIGLVVSYRVTSVVGGVESVGCEAVGALASSSLCPTGVSLSVQQNGILVSWTVEAATTYAVYRAEGAFPGPEAYSSIATGVTPPYLDEDVEDGVTYWYAIGVTPTGGGEARCLAGSAVAIPFFPGAIGAALATLGAVGAMVVARRR